MTDNSFFDESLDQSEVKSTIVIAYFRAWSRIMIGALKRDAARANSPLAYIDLFCGPGRYTDGTISTPLRVLQMAIHDSELRERLVTIFNDKDEESTMSLKAQISGLPGVTSLRHQPSVVAHEVGSDIASLFEAMRLVPTLFFVDPWGYKGLSLRLVNSIIKDWGCDCIFFFNYNRINMGLSNNAVRDHMDALFGTRRADNLRYKLSKLAPDARELTIVEELCRALQDHEANFVLPFRFRDAPGSRTSHHLIFVSKAFKGYELMKDIMAKQSSDSEQGVSNFEYNPAAALSAEQQPLLFQLSRPLDDLQKMLLDQFAGRTMSMVELYVAHNVGTPYTKSNYKKALLRLEEAGEIETTAHRAGTFADHVEVTFPNHQEDEHG